MKPITIMVIALIGGISAGIFGAPGWACLIAGWSLAAAVGHTKEQGR